MKKILAGPIPWLTPMLVLIFGVVLWPVYEMIRTSTLEISGSGKEKGFVGLDNYRELLENPNLVGAFVRTIFWVVVVVTLTILISLALAQLLNQDFPGRRYVRWALIVPWASSVIMTATSFRWMLDGYYGILNRILTDLGFIDESEVVEWLGSSSTSFPWLIVVAVFVSLPFTTFVILAGLQTIPNEIYEAARVDGASPRKTYSSITFPLLFTSLSVAAVINLINVFNQFPIIWVMTQGGPGYDTDTTTTLMYKLAFRSQEVGQSAALSVLNFAVILVFVLIYLKATGFTKKEQD
ncbi:carbohydrate ABC transporter permease [Candidatus Aquiluna sp. UB-MaderosW2red]|jgi:ABC-type sugar transport system permease subunit|uniref:carbohydrate ABC transporter permease n=1 Tax=Candidatus Aquiluna sp. UB-MaderosW2red TaxID=1855377 RepID=UPI000875B858|nr:sugar ABC transporter permease [Candidatus Aquiluna sp. UB-MaderosW2red]SCX03820.1 multiple sugar transport system permease protein [Candidatus Aquiluna sp. UB-MaderosW2red]